MTKRVSLFVVCLFSIVCIGFFLSTESIAGEGYVHAVEKSQEKSKSINTTSTDNATKTGATLSTMTKATSSITRSKKTTSISRKKTVSKKKKKTVKIISNQTPIKKVPRKYKRMHQILMKEVGKKHIVTLWFPNYSMEEFEYYYYKILPYTKEFAYNGDDVNYLITASWGYEGSNSYAHVNRSNLTKLYKYSAKNKKTVKRLVKKLKLSKTMTKRQRVKKIVRYLATHCKYYYKNYYNYYHHNNAYWCFRGKSKCAGYSRATKLLCNWAGVKCRVWYGSFRGSPHNFCQVRCGGKWHWSDTTFYSDLKKSKYLLHRGLWTSFTAQRIANP